MTISEIICGNCLDVLKQIPDNTIHCVVTSPPYFQLRTYHDNPVKWNSVVYTPMIGVSTISISGNECSHGMELLPEEYIGHEILIWNEIRRVLREDGVAWLNIDDSYAKRKIVPNPFFNEIGIQPKNLIGIPWRLAFALQASGWNLRNDNIWMKPTCSPESVTDRCTRNHEYIFQLTKSENYYYDNEAILEPCKSGVSDIKKMIQKKERIGGEHKSLDDVFSKASKITNMGRKRAVGNPIGKNHRTVWEIATAKGSKHGHLAVFPRKLVETAIRASISQGGCCSKCGNQYVRVIDKNYVPTLEEIQSGKQLSRTIGWRASCGCEAEKTKPVVLDPFCGTGTTGEVALNNNALFIGIDNNQEYVNLANSKINLSL